MYLYIHIYVYTPATPPIVDLILWEWGVDMDMFCRVHCPLFCPNVVIHAAL